MWVPWLWCLAIRARRLLSSRVRGRPPSGEEGLSRPGCLKYQNGGSSLDAHSACYFRWHKRPFCWSRWSRWRGVSPCSTRHWHSQPARPWIHCSSRHQGSHPTHHRATRERFSSVIVIYMFLHIFAVHFLYLENNFYPSWTMCKQYW